MEDDGEFFVLYVWKLTVNRLKKFFFINCVGVIFCFEWQDNGQEWFYFYKGKLNIQRRLFVFLRVCFSREDVIVGLEWIFYCMLLKIFKVYI